MTYPNVLTGNQFQGDTGRIPPTVVPRTQGGTGVNTTPAASTAFHPANPAATSSTSLVMMGLGSTCQFTPASSGKVAVTVTGFAQIATAAVPETVGARFGTGAAPANGAAVPGGATRFGAVGDQAVQPAAVGQGVGFSFTDVLQLVAGTTYWFDLALLTSAGADAASVTNVSMSFVETS